MRGRDWSFVAAVAAAGLLMTWPTLRRNRAERPREDGRDEPVEQVTAVQIAKEAGVDPRAFRAALRTANLSWHDPNAPWVADRGSPEHDDMMRVLEEMQSR